MEFLVMTCLFILSSPSLFTLFDTSSIPGLCNCDTFLSSHNFSQHHTLLLLLDFESTYWSPL
jgi:hypothetical protein